MAEYNLLQKKILTDGVIKPGNVLKVDSFLNHQMDIELFEKMGEEGNAVLPENRLIR